MLTREFLDEFDPEEASRWLSPAAVLYVMLHKDVADATSGRIAWG